MINIELTAEQMEKLAPIWDELEKTNGGAVLAQVSFYEGVACEVIPLETVRAIREATGATHGNGWQAAQNELWINDTIA